MVLPIAFYTSDTGFGGGAAAIASYHPDRARISTLQYIAVLTTKKQASTVIKWDHYLRRMRDRITVTAEYAKYPSYYFGIGNSTDNDDSEQYTPEYVAFEVSYERVLYRRFSIRSGIDFYNLAVVGDREGIIERAPFPRGRLDAGPSVALIWDSRDNTTATRHGTLLQLEYTGYMVQDDGGSFNRLSLDARHFIQPRPWLVLGFQGLYREARGRTPFYLMPDLGGGDRLRGYEQHRFTGRSALLIQHDTRFDIAGPIGGILFAAAGRVADGAGDLFDTDFHTAYGGGLRYYFNREEHMAIRFDYALSEDSSGVYITFGEAY